MRTLIITQARTGSTRLPGKIFREVNGKSLLSYHIDRLKKTDLPVLIATTVRQEDDPIEQFASENGILCFRGDENNVLERFYKAALIHQPDLIVRVTSDCPLIDPELILEGLRQYPEGSNVHYVSNALERTYPRGNDFEIFSFKLLQEAFLKASTDSQKEHVTPYINQNVSGSVQFRHIKSAADYSELRITVDTSEDFELIRRLIQEHNADELGWKEIAEILKSNPDLVGINKHIEQKKV